jgi:hypothetical protein
MKILLSWDKERLRIVLEELKYLRAELLQKFSHHIQLFAIVPTVLAFASGYIITQKCYDLLYIIPIFTLPITFRYLWEQQVIVIITKYIRDELIEKRLTDIVGIRAESVCDYERYWLGYEHYWMFWETKKMRELHWPLYFKHAAFLAFVFIPFFPCLMYSALLLSQNFLIDLGLSSYMPWPIHLIISIIYLVLSIYISQKIIR